MPAVSRIRHRILIIEARFHEQIADELARGAIAELETAGATYDRVAVPGALEIPQALARAQGGRDGKGGEAARACLRLIEIARQLQGQGA